MFTTRGRHRRSRRSRRRSPDALVRLHVDPLEGFQPYQARRLIYGGRRRRIPASRSRSSTIVGKLYRCFVESDAMLARDQPADRHAGRRGARARLEVHGRRRGALPSPRHRRVARHGRRRSARGVRPREGRHLREARRRGRHPRQRRRALDVDGRRRRRRRRAARELLRPRRRRQRRGRRRRARGDHARPAGALDLLQHLRRDHALRRGRARHPRPRSSGWGSSCRSSSGSTARTPRRAGACSRRRRRRTCHVEPTMLDAARAAVELAA